MSLESCNYAGEVISRLRYVKPGDPVLPEDIDNIIVAIGYLYACVQDYLQSVGVYVDLSSQLQEIIARLVRVRSGDIILPEHHNQLVDALKALYEYVKQATLSAYEEGKSEILVQLPEICTEKYCPIRYKFGIEEPELWDIYNSSRLEDNIKATLNISPGG